MVREIIFWMIIAFAFGCAIGKIIYRRQIVRNMSFIYKGYIYFIKPSATYTKLKLKK